jgi:predicted alpha/beta-fold hydrolase
VHTTDYRPPLPFRSAHLQTVYPALFRTVPLVTSRRERIETADGDFLDLDWSPQGGGKRLAILTHGLEGHSRGPYCQGMARALQRAGWDVLAWNFRGCSGEPNRKLQSYHSGATEELQIVLDHVFLNTAYDEIFLVGFSLGGNLMLKHLGDAGPSVDQRIRAAVALSVPCDLASSARRLEHWQNRIYMSRFMRSLRRKVQEKANRFPNEISTNGLDQMRTFAEFDDVYTGPIHGFKDADDYWNQCSCLAVLADIAIPTRLINALDDPFLTPACFPHEAAAANPFFQMETPRHGGHLGFVEFNDSGLYWSEQRAVEFFRSRV